MKTTKIASGVTILAVMGGLAITIVIVALTSHYPEAIHVVTPVQHVIHHVMIRHQVHHVQVIRLLEYHVRPGDTLWTIAGKLLHSPEKWHQLWIMNRNEIHNPNEISTWMIVRY